MPRYLRNSYLHLEQLQDDHSFLIFRNFSLQFRLIQAFQGVASLNTNSSVQQDNKHSKYTVQQHKTLAYIVSICSVHTVKSL